MLTASSRTRSRSVRGDEKDRHRRLFSGVWVPVPNKYFAEMHILLSCLLRLFSVGLGFPPHMNTPPFRVRKDPFCQGFWGSICRRSLASHRPQTLSGLLRFWGGYGIPRLSAGHTRACYFFVLWCPTVQNHAITTYAALFVGFEKTPISCGLTGLPIIQFATLWGLN